MNRPYIFCHMMTSLDGKIMGDYMETPEGEQAGSVFYDIAFGKAPYYKHQGWLSGRVTTDDNFTFYEQPELDAEAPIVPEGDFVAQPDAGMYYVSVDPSGKLGWKNCTLTYVDTTAHVLEVLTEKASNAYKAFLRKLGISYIIAGQSELDYALAMKKLKELFHIETLMLGGGEGRHLLLAQLPPAENGGAHIRFGDVLPGPFGQKTTLTVPGIAFLPEAQHAAVDLAAVGKQMRGDLGRLPEQHQQHPGSQRIQRPGMADLLLPQPLQHRKATSGSGAGRFVEHQHSMQLRQNGGALFGHHTQWKNIAAMRRQVKDFPRGISRCARKVVKGMAVAPVSLHLLQQPGSTQPPAQGGDVPADPLCRRPGEGLGQQGGKFRLVGRLLPELPEHATHVVEQKYFAVAA